MTFYHRLGEVPHKRHTRFRKPDGTLYREEVMGLEGFSGIQSILYHHYLPPAVVRTEFLGPAAPEYVEFRADPSPRLRHGGYARRRRPGFGAAGAARQRGRDALGISRPAASMDYFYRNQQAYELWFAHEGQGVLRSQFGRLPFGPGDYIIIPYGVTWRMELESDGARFFVVESKSRIEPPRRYRNEYGQLLEHSPYCERDIRVPEELETIIERGEYEVRVKVRDTISRHILDHHPFDVVGWDGYLYPWAFSIHDFEPITGRVHQPPPVHQTFAGHNFVVCSFVPRLFDYHPEAIPAPYNHSNVNSDEVIYYCEGNFMSRRGIDQYDITPAPERPAARAAAGATEASIGAERTEELAVMVDTFRPLHLTPDALELEKPEYMSTWLDGDGA